jgi:hypothetical protein
MLRLTKLKLFPLVALLTLSIFLVSFVPKSLADSGQIYLSPSSTTVTDGQTFTLNLMISPGTSVNAVQATVSYSTSLLQYNSDSLGAFSTCTQNSGGGGNVSLSCAMLGSSTSSTSEIASISFTSLSGSGSTSLGVSGEAANAGSYTNPSTAGATVSFYTPAPSGSSGSSGSGSSNSGSSSSSKSTSKTTTSKATSTGSSTASTTTTTATPQATAAPTVVLPKVNITSVSAEASLASASIDATSTSSVQSLVRYGTSEADLSQSVGPGTSGKSSVTKLTGLKPTTTYYYQVVDQISGNTVVTSSVKSFKTKGFTVSVAVLDGKDKPLANQIVYLHTAPVKGETNSKGIATFYNVPSGVHHLDYSSNGKSYSQLVYVSNEMTTLTNGTQTTPIQNQSVILTGLVAKTSSSSKSIILTAVLLIILCLAFIAISASNRREILKSGPGRFTPHIKGPKLSHQS